ncbi:HAD hydrolase-like protein [Aeromonas jandaei]|uniref:HAD hydrolase-like protein n=1 Tax=Aeromonas jandaei TaxID=650 RepID=UPI00191DFAB2|nr:HAD hydrolase-like protein [Aeromonas jandaei]MBL0626529.1 HAD hydrolase-like protein [Aeromonas jandaei]
MDIIIFDLDFTLVDTTDCQPYLMSSAGRDVIVNLIMEGEIDTETYDDIVDYFNELSDEDDILVIVVSDSPKDYCMAILEHHGFEIDEDLVFGSAGKPCTDFNTIINSLRANEYIGAREINDYIVVGDSAKDIYFAHEIGCPSIFARWGGRYRSNIISRKSKPTIEVRDIEELKSAIDEFILFGIDYQGVNIKDEYTTVDAHEISPHQISQDDIGYSREYVPAPESWTKKTHEYTWMDMNLTIKKAKTLTVHELKDNCGVLYLTRAGEISESTGLKSIAGHYKKEFYAWMEKKKINGRVALIPVPSSLPSECNRSSPTKVICKWWAEWASREKDEYSLEVLPCVERWKPTHASHKRGGVRTITPHLETMGVYAEVEPDDFDGISSIIIFDDVVTSGSQMNSVATILKTLELIDDSVSIYGYALARTIRPSNLSRLDFSQWLKEIDATVSKD